MNTAPDAATVAEQSVLGGLLLDNSARQRINGLAVESFATEAHRIIYAAICDTLDDAGAADTVGVFERLQRAGNAERAGGLAYLSALSTSTPSAANIGAYAELVERNARRRERRQALRDAYEAEDRGDDEAARRALERAAKLSEPAKQSAELPQVLDIRTLASTEPPKPAFVVRDWLPCGEVALFAGHGGTGKSAIALHLAVCVALGKPFFGIPCERRRVFVLSLEDTAAVLHWRLARTCAWLDVEISTLAGWLTIADGADIAGELLTETRDGATLTSVYGWLAERMKGAEVLVIDGASDAFGGNEINRRAVRMFVRAIRRLIPRTGGALLLSHVDKATAKSGDTSQGYSGSTAWSNSVRARWYLRPDEAGGLVLELQKANLAPAGATIAIHWNESAHVFVGQVSMPAGKMERAFAESDERAAVLELIRAAPEPMPAAMRGERTAHSFAEARGLPDALRGRRGRARFYQHIEALRAAGAVRIEAEKRPNRHFVEVIRAV